jgi:hypothetical protein
LPITALRETPIAAAIWLQVMPVPTQARSCSMRSGVQVAVDVAVEVAFELTMFFGAGPTVAGSRVVRGSGSIGGDERGRDGAMDGDMTRPHIIAAAGLGRRQGVCPRAAGNRETQNLEAKIGARL